MKLSLTKYEPKLSDPRVLRRTEQVMTLCKKMYDLEAEQPILARDLRKSFGNYSMKNTLACWLYSNLLEQTLWYEVGGQPYSYRVNRDGYLKVLNLLDQAKNQS